MKKQIRALIAGVILLVALGGLWLFLAQNPQPEEAAEETRYVAGNVQADQIKAITIQQGQASFRLAADAEGAFTLENWGDIPLNNDLLGQSRTAAAAIPVKLVVSEEGGDLSKYGLQNPPVRVVLSVEGQTDVTLNIGNEAPANEGVYVSVEGQSPVYLVAANSLSFANRAPTDYVSLVASAVEDPTNPPAFSAAVLSGEEREATVEVSTQLDESGTSTFFMTAPVRYKISSTAINLLQSATSITAEGVAAVRPSETQLETLGLKEPYATLTLSLEDGTSVVVKASRPAESGALYFMLEGRPVIYMGSTELLSWVQMPYSSLLSTIPVSMPLTELDSIQVTIPQKQWSFAVTGEGDALKATLDGKEVDADQFRRLYQGIHSASFGEHTDLRPEGEPVMTFAYKAKDGRTREVRFYEGPVRKLFITAGDLEPQFFTGTTYMDQILANLERIAAGEAVQAVN
ncbi:DUF4340 domain-containing protein [Oscillospiraceae bacterium MB08-C2-2]|nr:DUF4340 domain-containing protein [Oscillospiraceae bacterium MB08-C2-2]